MGRAKRLAGLALAVLALAGSGRAAAEDGAALSGLEGGQLTQSDLARGVTIIVVWASWSPRCRDIVERVKPLAERWGGKARVVTVNFQEDRGAVEGFLRDKSLGVPVFLDGDGAFSKRHAVTTLPGLLVFVDGRVAYGGRLPEDPDRVIAPAVQ